MNFSRTFLCVAVLAALSIASLTTEAGSDAGIVQEVTKLLQAKMDDSVIMAFIAKKGVAGDLSADDLLTLKEAGASPELLIALMGGKVPGIKSQTDGFPFDLDDSHEVGPPIRHGIMDVFPIVRKAPAEIGTYLTLDEAMEQNTVVVKEKGDGSVPVVIIINNGKLPIYISAGEVIIGGKQDRIVAYDVIIRPQRELTIDVRCVEHGRWRGAQKEFSSARAMGGKKTKMAALFRAQQDVWNEVGAQNSRVEAESSTGSYRAALEKPEVQRIHKEYADAILTKLAERDLVGMIVAINGKVHAIEIFGSPSLFEKLKGKLLKAYVLDTVGVEDAKAAAPSKDVILSFYKTTMAAERERLKDYESNGNVKRDAPDAACNDAVDADGMLLHRSLLAK